MTGLKEVPPESPDHGQNFHAMTVEYTFADGSTAIVGERGIPDCECYQSDLLEQQSKASCPLGQVIAAFARHGVDLDRPDGYGAGLSPRDMARRAAFSLG